MEEERMRWITSPPTLDRWETGVRIAATPSGATATATTLGYCDRRRGALWSYSETVPVGEGIYDLYSHVGHVHHVCATVRPVTEPALLRALAGQYWEQESLFD